MIYSYSRVLAKPVTWGLVSSEHFFSELLVATGLDSVHLESGGVHVDEVILGEHVGDWVHSGGNGQEHHNHHLLVWHLGFGDKSKILRDVVGHLRSGGWGAIVVLNHTIVQLWRHSNNHMIVVRVEMSTLWNIETERWVVVVTGQEVVRVVDQTWGVGKGLRKIWRPDTHVGVLSLVDSHVWRPHSIMDNALSVVPLLEVITSVLLVTWVHLRKENHLVNEFSLLETLVHKQIVLLVHGTVAALTGTLPDLEASSEGGGVVGVPGDLRWPVVVTVMHTN